MNIEGFSALFVQPKIIYFKQTVAWAGLIEISWNTYIHFSETNWYLLTCELWANEELFGYWTILIE